MKMIKIRLAFLRFKLLNKLYDALYKLASGLSERADKAADCCRALIDERIRELEEGELR